MPDAPAADEGRPPTEAEIHAEHVQALEQTLFGRAAPSAAEHVYRLEHGALRRVRRPRERDAEAG